MTWTIESLTTVGDGLIEVGLSMDYLGFRHRIKVLVDPNKWMDLGGRVDLRLEPVDHG